MLKAAGAAIVFAACAILGFAKASELDREASEIGTLCAYLEEFALLLRARRAATEEILRELAQQGQFADLAFAQRLWRLTEARVPFAQAMLQSTENFGKYYREVLAEAVLPLGDAIGVRELQSQLAALALAGRRTSRLHTQALERCRSHCALYRRLGVLGGILITIILV